MLLCIGVKESTTINSVFTFINLGVVTFVIIAGSIKAKTSNWAIPADQVTDLHINSVGKD